VGFNADKTVAVIYHGHTANSSRGTARIYFL
jgi:hypothetical protein